MRKQTKLLLEENNRLEEALQPEARSLLTDVVVYLRGSRVSTWKQEQVRRDVTRMLLDAQARGEDAREVIGPDPRAFCDSVIEALPPMPPCRAPAVHLAGRPAGGFDFAGPMGGAGYCGRAAGRGKLAQADADRRAVLGRRRHCGTLLSGGDTNLQNLL